MPVDKTILSINGPNLARLGTRNPEQYGLKSLKDISAVLKNRAERAGVTLVEFQSNEEGKIIGFIEEHFDAAGLLINPGALMMNGWGLRECLADFGGHKCEVHLSNLWTRESFRHQSLISPVVDVVISGAREQCYTLGLEYLIGKCAPDGEF